MRKRLLFRVEAILSGRDDTRADDARRRAARLADECGCALGGVFLWVALLGGTVLVIVEDARPLSFLVAFVSVLAAAGLGKVVGILVATLRLLLLVHRL